MNEKKMFQFAEQSFKTFKVIEKIRKIELTVVLNYGIESIESVEIEFQMNLKREWHQIDPMKLQRTYKMLDDVHKFR